MRKIICFLMLLQGIALFAFDKGYDNRLFCADHAWNKTVSLRYISSSKSKWQGFSVEGIKSAAKKIPSQNSHSELRAWSCGPNSLARSFELLGANPLKTEAEFVDFVLAFPKSIGSYTDMEEDVSFAITNPLLGAISIYSRALAINAPFHAFLSSYNMNVGTLPAWFVSYANDKFKDFEFKHVHTKTFSEIKQVMLEELSVGSALIPLVIFSAGSWHYLNIVSFNERDQEVVVLDTDGQLNVWSLDMLACLMNTSYNSKDAYMDFDNSLNYLISTGANQFSHVGYYNLIVLKNNRKT